MLKKFFIAVLGIFTGIFSAPLSNWISGDEKANLLSLRQLIVSTLCFLVFSAFIIFLESAQAINWNWPWHRFWFFQGVLERATSIRRQKIFELPEPVSKVSITEVKANGGRKNLVNLLLEKLKSEAGVRHILVIGEPGSGKTITLEHLESGLAQQGAKRLGIGTPIPILVRMGGYETGKILDYVKEVMEKGSKSSAKLSQGLDKLLKKGRVALLFDALDEALGRNPGAAMEIESLLSNYQYARTPIVISGRSGEYEKLLPADIEILKVQELSDDAVLSLVQLHLTKVENQPDATEVTATLEAEGLLKKGALGRNPFWLDLILKGGTFENNKAKIFDSAVSALLEREWNKKGSKRLWTRPLNREEQLLETREGLTWLAYQMSVGNKGEEIDGEETIKIINDYLSKRIGVAGLRPQDILWLGRDAQLIDFNSFTGKNGWQPIRFRHRLIREYLTAYELSKKSDLAIKALDQYSTDIRWWEILLMLGSLNRGQIGSEHHAFVKTAAGDGSDPRRLLLASVMLDSIDAIFNRKLRAATIEPLIINLKNGMTKDHIEAVTALADIAPNRLVKLLRGLVNSADDGLTPIVENIIRELLQDESKGESRPNLTATLLGDIELRSIVVPILISIGKPSVAPLIRVLRDSDFAVRWYAAEALGDIRDARAVEPLISLLDDPDDTVRRTAVESLGKIGDVRALIPIAKALKLQEDKSVQDYLMNTTILQALGNIGEPAIDELIRMLGIDDITMWGFASRSLQQIGKPAVKPLSKALDKGSSNAFFHHEIINILGEIGDVAAIEPLIGVLKREDFILKVVTSKALRKIGEPAVEPLIHLLEDKSLYTRQKAANILGKLADKRAVNPLITLLGNRQVDERRKKGEDLVRAEAAAALGNIGDERALGPLREAIEEDMLLVGLRAAASLVKLGDREALKILHNILVSYNDPSEPSITSSVQFIIVCDLGELKDSKSLAYLECFLRRQSDIPAADKKLNEEQSNARREAGRSIEKITTYLLNIPEDSRSRGDESEDGIKERDLSMYSKLLTHQDESVRVDAVAALAEIGEPVVNLLLEALSNDSPDVRRDAAISLGIVKSESAVEPLIKIFQTDANNVVRKAAAEALGNVGDARALAPLREALALEDRFLIVKIGAATALGQLGEAGMVDLLYSLSSSADIPSVRVVIAKAFEELGDPSALPYLEEMLKKSQENEQVNGSNVKDIIVGVIDHIKAAQG